MKKKIKVDIITMQGVCNYGSVLQAFATQELFKKVGIEPRIINYYRSDVCPDNLLHSWANGSVIKYVLMLPTILRWKKVFGGFRTKWLNIGNTTYITESDFSRYPLEADAYCTGSDQVWNSKWNKGIEKALYLNFVPDEKIKFSFASSFGQEVLSNQEVQLTSGLINGFKYLSSRELSGVDILKHQYKRDDAKLILDPTLCLDGTFWRRYKTYFKKKNERYILIYNLNRSKEFDAYAKKISQITGIKLVRFCTRYDQIIRLGIPKLVPEVFDFIGLIDDAEMVITDSFHATAFSINMHTKPICLYPDQFGGRLDSFLKYIGEEQLHPSSYDDYSVLDHQIDFSSIDSILKKNRATACEFLSQIVELAQK